MTAVVRVSDDSLTMPHRHIEVSDAELAASYVTPRRARMFRLDYERDYRP